MAWPRDIVNTVTHRFKFQLHRNRFEIVRTSFTNIRANANAIIQTLLELKLKRLLYTHFKVICSY